MTSEGAARVESHARESLYVYRCPSFTTTCIMYTRAFRNNAFALC